MLKKHLIPTLIFLIAVSFITGCGGDEATFITVLQGILTGEGSTVPGQPTTIKDVDGFGVTIPPEALPEGVESVDVALGRVTNPQNLDTTCAIGIVRFIEVKYGIEVVVGTHPIPQSYFETHRALATWESSDWQAKIGPTVTDEAVRRAYD